MAATYSFSPDGKFVAVAYPWDSNSVDRIEWFTAEEWAQRNGGKP